MSIMAMPGGFQFAFGANGPQVAPVAAPERPNPKAVSEQKEEHAKSLETNLKGDADRLGTEMKSQIDALHTQATQEKALHSLLVDQQVKQQELLLSQQYNQQLMLLTQAAQRQGAELEQQATNLMLDYQQRKVEEDFVASQAGVEKQFADMQQKFSDELAKSCVYPAPPIQPPVLGQGMQFNLAPPLLPALAPPVQMGLPGGQGPAHFLPYMPPSSSTAAGSTAGIRAPGYSSFSGRPSPQGASFSPASTRVTLPGQVPGPGQSSFSSAHAARLTQVQATAAPVPLQSYVPGQASVTARPGAPHIAGRSSTGTTTVLQQTLKR